MQQAHTQTYQRNWNACILSATHWTNIAVNEKVNVYLSSLMMKVPDHVYVLG
jgi:hypothetical protein